ncbi:beta subunit of anthranilate synthase [Chloropicon primus]|nr:beta subunit of anthranilate synthase [Chloropicon primus]
MRGVCGGRKAPALRTNGAKGRSVTCKAKNTGALEAKLESARGKVVVVDNYDSFTYNLCQYLGSLKTEYVVFKNDEVTVDQIDDAKPRGILVSPGPGTPEESGISLETVEKLGPKFPLFGVCMGHQCIGQIFGGNVIRAKCGVMHGKTSPVFHNDTGVLKGLSSPFDAARYHSLVIEEETFPEDQLEVLGWCEDGTIMAVQHKDMKHIQGVQFHPESVICPEGMKIVQNFVDSL